MVEESRSARTQAQSPCPPPSLPLLSHRSSATACPASPTPVSTTAALMVIPRESPYHSQRHGSAASLKQVRENNVRLMFWHVFCFTVYQSICQWNLFDAYLSFLAKEKKFVNTNTWVGFAEGISGVTSLVLAIPLGILVDKFDRIKLVKLAGIVGLVAAVISAYAFAFDHLTTLYTNLFLWGLYAGLEGTAAEAVFADSIEKGKRSKKFTIKGVLNTCGLSLGPLLMLMLFLTIGDEWELHQLHIPLLVGCCFAPLACFPLFLMGNPKPNISLRAPQSSSSNTLQTPLLAAAARHTPLLNPTSPLMRRDRIGSAMSNYAELCDDTPLEEEHGSERGMLEKARALTEDDRLKNLSQGERDIPFILTAADFITEVGAGMTVRFFPLFFINDYGVSPMVLCGIFCAYPLCVSIAMPICQLLSRSIGRAQASFIFQLMGISMLILMTFIADLRLLIIVFMLRGQLQNAAYPVDRSILMDYIPSKHRGKWNSIASLTTMTWSGSAVLGGYLADRQDYRFTFLITAVVYTIGVATYLPLLWLVPRKEDQESCDARRRRYVHSKVKSPVKARDVSHDGHKGQFVEDTCTSRAPKGPFVEDTCTTATAMSPVSVSVISPASLSASP